MVWLWKEEGRKEVLKSNDSFGTWETIKFSGCYINVGS